MKKKLKVAVIGGGSSYTPEFMEGFIERYDEMPVNKLYLVDIEARKRKTNHSRGTGQKNGRKSRSANRCHLNL